MNMNNVHLLTKCMLRIGTLWDWDSKGEFGHFFDSRLSASLNIFNSNICETRRYFEFTATNRMSEKNMLAEIFGAKVGKVGYF